jgi:histidine triad (HIT) family protein
MVKPVRCIFCEFISGKKLTHDNGLPYVVIRETANTVSFLDQEFPNGTHPQILVIPKCHEKDIAKLQRPVLHELIDHLSLIAKVLDRRKTPCNILLNNGKIAGQVIPHVHFHMIPRMPHDKIKIESWTHRDKISKNQYLKINQSLRRACALSRRS